MFNRRKNKSEQRGTLMVEAIAMLGLIAIVTPTLYKKSAERLQEIQDINMATQARTMSTIIETFIRNNVTAFRDFDEDSTTVIRICEEDGCSELAETPAHRLERGYSSVIPYGFTPGDIKNFGKPEVYAVYENKNIVFYVIYPKVTDLGKKRAARLASLVGANGGLVDSPTHILGTGGAWELDSALVSEVGFDSSLMTENSLVLTNNEPILAMVEDTDIYLYRVPADEEEAYHNTMVTDLYLGGNADTEEGLKYENNAKEYYSIFNVRKMTMNTNCSAAYINSSGASWSSMNCDPDIADLYIGKPSGKFGQQPRSTGQTTGDEKNYQANTGAAWIYGNLAALSDRFKLFHSDYSSVDGTHEYERKGYDILQFSRLGDSVEVWNGDSDTGGSNYLEVFRATNEVDSAEVAMMDGFVRVVEDFGKEIDDATYTNPAFLVGGTVTDSASVADKDAYLIAARTNAAGDEVVINSRGDNQAQTMINKWGGDVFINGGNSDEDLDSSGTIRANTYINQGGGTLQAGKDADWIRAGGIDDSAYVDVLINGGGEGSADVDRHFSVGGAELDASHMIWANKNVTSLRDGAVRAYVNDPTRSLGAAETGKVAVTAYGGEVPTELTNGVVLAAKYTDVLGTTYMGYDGGMSSSIDASHEYDRSTWRLGVAGSAWVDDLLFAERTWFNRAGMKELHAGHSSLTGFENAPGKAWLNVYDNGMVVRNRAGITGSEGNSSLALDVKDARFYADSTTVYMGDSKGSKVALEEGEALIGWGSADANYQDFVNYMGADSSKAFVVGNNLVEIYTSSKATNNDKIAVDIQKGAMLFKGHSWNSSGAHDYSSNLIEAHAHKFGIYTGADYIASTAVSGESSAAFLVDKDSVRTKFVKFDVRDKDDKTKFLVRPNEKVDSSLANVMVDGSFHVTGNKVIHVASHSSYAAGADDQNPHAMFEVDPRFVKVLARKDADNFVSSGISNVPLAMLKINPFDVNGGSSVANDVEQASVYVRRGAIELEMNDSSTPGGADEGYGYIKASRLVDNNGLTVPVFGTGDPNSYDKYMVNPAYTSVMHDIKLTTRGGARLSDILPDYILKGVYNVSNDYKEGTTTKDPAAWADPYVGIIPYAVCPPQYRNMATIVPISFQMGQAGTLVKDATGNRYTVAIDDQAKVLSAVGSAKVVPAHPRLFEVKTASYTKMVSTSASWNFPDEYKEYKSGWALGLEMLHGEPDNKELSESSIVNGVTQYTENKTSADALKKNPRPVAYPLYFQQNTYLKTSVKPAEGNTGWEGRIGFLYDTDKFKNLGDGAGNKGIRSNNNAVGYNDGTAGGSDAAGNMVWNLFPIVTGSLEGHATVYCYFDRSKFAPTPTHPEMNVDPIDYINNPRGVNPDGSPVNKPDAYVKRLNDPNLKYTDPW